MNLNSAQIPLLNNKSPQGYIARFKSEKNQKRTFAIVPLTFAFVLARNSYLYRDVHVIILSTLLTYSYIHSTSYLFLDNWILTHVIPSLLV